MVKGVTNFQEIKRFILDIEQIYTVDQWVYNDIYFWPHIRVQLYYALIHSLKKEDFKAVLEQHPEKSSISKLDGLKQLWKSYINYKRFFKSTTSKALLFMSLDMHKVKHEGVYFNRFFDSMISANELEKDSFTFEIKKSPLPCYNQASVEKVSPYLDFHYKKYKLLRFFNRFQNKQAHYLEGLDQLKQFLIECGLYKIADQLVENKIGLWSTKIRVYADFYTQYLIKTQTKKVIAVSYYGFDSMWSCMFAANQLGITSVDFQHGPQTEVHMAYASWTKVPKNGFSIMPKEYWCWDEESAKEINRWAVPVGTNAKTYGQPWLAHIQNKQVQEGFQERALVVLYSLQTFPLFTLENTFTPEIIKLIKKSKHKWVLRLHPSNTQESYLIKDYLNKQEVEKGKYTIQRPNDTPLPTVLSRSLLHITNYSGCTIEARELGVKTVLIDAVGLEMFKSYIDKELVIYLDKKGAGFYNDLEEVIGSTVKNKVFRTKDIPNPLFF
jgi:hypothetical protein